MFQAQTNASEGSIAWSDLYNAVEMSTALVSMDNCYVSIKNTYFKTRLTFIEGTLS
jgi:hypothetical protein